MSEDNKSMNHAAMAQAGNAVQAAAQATAQAAVQAVDRVLAARPLLTPVAPAKAQAPASVHRRVVEENDDRDDDDEGENAVAASEAASVLSNEHVRSFLDTVSSESVRNRHRNALQRFSNFLAKPLLSAHLDDLHAYDVMVTNSPKENDGLPRSQVTVSFLIEDIKDFYTYLYEAGVLASNVMAEFGPTLTKIKGRSASPTPKASKIRKARRLNCIALTWAQVKRLFRYLATRKELIARRDRAMFLLMLHGGLKPHDIHEMVMKDFTALPSGGARLRLRHSGGTVDIPAALYRDIMAYRTAVTDHPATPDMPVFCSFKPQQPARWNCHTVVNHALTARSRAAGFKFNVDPSILSKTKEALDAEDFDFIGLLLKQYPVKIAKKAKAKAAVKTKSKPVSAPPPEEKTLFDDVEDVVKSVEPPVKATAPVAVPAPQDDTPFLEWLTAQLHKAQRQARSLPGGEALEATLSELFDRVFRRVHPGADA